MCTAVTYKTKNFYFGRTLDYDFSYSECVTVMPRNFPCKFRYAENAGRYAVIGMAYILGGYPLFYDAANECGLCMAGLNFTGFAKYHKRQSGKINLCQFEFVPYILRNCKNLKSAVEELKKINIIPEAFSAELPAAQLHWIIADKTGAVTVESVEGGLKVYENKAGVLTNNPPFSQQLLNLNNFLHLTNEQPQSGFCGKMQKNLYTLGLGALGLPGDLSSQSRFVRAAFTALNSISPQGENESVNQFFHILGAVEQARGCNKTEKGYEITIYSSCISAERGIYYYTTYSNHCICAVDMNKLDLGSKTLFTFPLKIQENIIYQT